MKKKKRLKWQPYISFILKLVKEKSRFYIHHTSETTYRKRNILFFFSPFIYGDQTKFYLEYMDSVHSGLLLLLPSVLQD